MARASNLHARALQTLKRGVRVVEGWTDGLLDGVLGGSHAGQAQAHKPGIRQFKDDAGSNWILVSSPDDCFLSLVPQSSWLPPNSFVHRIAKSVQGETQKCLDCEFTEFTPIHYQKEAKEDQRVEQYTIMVSYESGGDPPATGTLITVAWKEETGITFRHACFCTDS